MSLVRNPVVGARCRLALCSGVLLASPVFAADEFLGIRNYNPFAQVYGLPEFADATVLAPRQTSLAVTTAIINHSEIAIDPDEALSYDGEAYITDLAFSVGVSERLTMGAALPWVAYTGGVFDGAIEGWHDLWGFPNGVRDRQPHDELLMAYSSGGENVYLLERFRRRPW